MTDSIVSREKNGHDQALAALRQGSGRGEITSSTEIAPGIALHADPEAGASGSWISPAGRLLEIAVSAPPEGRWTALHVGLDAADLAGRDWLGLIARSAAPGEVMVRPCLRSGHEGGFSDCFFPRHLLSTAEPMTHADALHLPSTPEIPGVAPWRELVLFLPRGDVTWHLHDLRLVLA